MYCPILLAYKPTLLWGSPIKIKKRVNIMILLFAAILLKNETCGTLFFIEKQFDIQTVADK